MRPMAKNLDATQIHDVAVYLTGREPGNDPQPDIHANMCKDDGGPIDLASASWNGCVPWMCPAKASSNQLRAAASAVPVPPPVSWPPVRQTTFTGVPVAAIPLAFASASLSGNSESCSPWLTVRRETWPDCRPT